MVVKTSWRDCARLVIIVILCGVGYLGIISRAFANQCTTSFLSEADQSLYTGIFAFQDEAKWAQADSLIARLQSPLLMGAVLAQRYLHPKSGRINYDTLSRWLQNYSDLPQASAILTMALKRRPPNNKDKLSISDSWPQVWKDDWQREKRLIASEPELDYRRNPFKAEPVQSPNYSVAARRALNQIEAMVQKGQLSQAVKYLHQKPNAANLGVTGRALAWGRLARGYFRYQQDQEAVSAAEAGLAEDTRAGEALWWGGLAAFRQNDYDRAANWFERLSQNQGISPRDIRGAAAFWAYRSYLRAGKFAAAQQALSSIETDDRNFYALLGMAARGTEWKHDWSLPPVDPAYTKALFTVKPIQRGFSLFQLNRYDEANAELSPSGDNLPSKYRLALLKLADECGLAGLSYQLARGAGIAGQASYLAALYPLPQWLPERGYELDRALVYAFVRQESRFQLSAVSTTGASGLLQLMPGTAKFIARQNDESVDLKNLSDSSQNLFLGQRYIKYLMDEKDISGNLFFLFTSYNAGPGNFRKWRQQFADTQDPLMFLEAIPSRETRDFVEQVMANLWIYQSRLGQQQPSLVDLLQGNWPIYVALDGSNVERHGIISNQTLPPIKP